MEELLGEDEMFRAYCDRDGSYEGLFFVGVATTGIFCRPGCSAKRPLRENVEFFRDRGSAMRAGYRPCRLCRPLEEAGSAPEGIAELIKEVEADPTLQVGEAGLRERGLSAEAVRRWFKARYGLSFLGWQRLLRVNAAIGLIRGGKGALEAGLDAGFGSASAFGEAVKKATGAGPRAAARSRTLAAHRFGTPLGPMIALATEEALVLLEFTDRRMLERGLGEVGRRLGAVALPGRNAILDQAEAEMAEYFEGKRRAFSVPIAPVGSDFQRSVWDMLVRIPYGEAWSYGRQAKELGAAEKVRAVARANGENKIAVIVPCHRVVGADGSLTGYGGGLWRKRWLLAHEKKNKG